MTKLERENLRAILSPFSKFSFEKLAEVRRELFEDWDEDEWDEPRRVRGNVFKSSLSSNDGISSVTEDSITEEPSEDAETLADGSGPVKVSVVRLELK